MNGLIVALTLCLNNPAPGPVDGIEPRDCYELAVYASREECRISAVRLRVHTPGARLLCHPRPLSPDELLEIARGPGSTGGGRAMIDLDALKVRVAEANGDPECLHCQLAKVLNELLDVQPTGRPHAMTTMTALGQIVGEIVGMAPDGFRAAALNTVVQTIAERAGVGVRSRDKDGNDMPIVEIDPGRLN